MNGSMMTNQANTISVLHLNEEGQLTLPIEYLRAQALTPESALVAIQVGEALVLAPEDEALAAATAPLEAAWENSGLSQADMLKALDEIRRRVVRDKFGALSEDEP